MFFKHRHVKKHGYEIYKKNKLLIESGKYEKLGKRLKDYMHREKGEGDMLIGLYDSIKNNILFLPKYAGPEEYIKIKEIISGDKNE